MGRRSPFTCPASARANRSILLLGRQPSQTRDYANQITITPVSTNTRSVRVTASSAEGVPLMVAVATGSILLVTKASAICRRQKGLRSRILAAKVICWSAGTAPASAAAIEIDASGARLILSWRARPQQRIKVSIGDDLGFYETCQARVIWAQKLETTGKVVAGIAFDRDVYPDLAPAV